MDGFGCYTKVKLKKNNRYNVPEITAIGHRHTGALNSGKNGDLLKASDLWSDRINKNYENSQGWENDTDCF